MGWRLASKPYCIAMNYTAKRFPQFGGPTSTQVFMLSDKPGTPALQWRGDVLPGWTAQSSRNVTVSVTGTRGMWRWFAGKAGSA